MSTPKNGPSNKKAIGAPKNAAVTKQRAPASRKPGAKEAAAETIGTNDAVASAGVVRTSKRSVKAAQATEKATAQPTAAVAGSVSASGADGTAKVKRTKPAKKEKVVRDSFTMPRSDYAKIASLKQKCANNGRRVKKSELLRAALTLLDAAPEKRLLAAIDALETVQTGRPPSAD
jgi:hypothetical protein